MASAAGAKPNKMAIMRLMSDLKALQSDPPDVREAIVTDK